MMVPRIIRIAGATISKHAPEILTGSGLLLGGGCVVTSCRATLKADEMLKNKTLQREEIERKLSGEIELETPYTEDDAKHDKRMIRKETAKELVKDYWLPVTLGTGSVVCILSGHHVLAKRFGTVATALTATTGAFAEYRRRVAEEYGEEAEYAIRQGKAEQRETIDDHTEIITPGRKELRSCYAVVFDERNPNWSPDYRANKLFLTKAQNYLTDRLKADGFLFWSDVLDYLGFPRRGRPAAAHMVGWYYDPNDPTRDNVVDLGFDTANDVTNGEFGARQMLLGGIPLDPNVDGPILDKLPKLFPKRPIDENKL